MLHMFVDTEPTSNEELQLYPNKYLVFYECVMCITDDHQAGQWSWLWKKVADRHKNNRVQSPVSPSFVTEMWVVSNDGTSRRSKLLIDHGLPTTGYNQRSSHGHHIGRPIHGSPHQDRSRRPKVSIKLNPFGPNSDDTSKIYVGVGVQVRFYLPSDADMRTPHGSGSRVWKKFPV